MHGDVADLVLLHGNIITLKAPGDRAQAVAVAGEKIVAVAQRGGRNKVNCIILGRGEDDKRVHEWLEIAASVPGFIGFAVGRTTFWEPVVGWRANKLTREAAVAEVARRYQEFVDIFERGKRGAGWTDAA